MRLLSITFFLATLFILALPLTAASPGIVTRSLSWNDDATEIMVTLDVDIDEGERYFIIEEKPPSGWEILDSGELVEDSNGYLKFVQLQDATDMSFVYRLKKPATAYSENEFAGIYQIDGMDEPEDIGGLHGVEFVPRTDSVSQDTDFTLVFTLVTVIILVLAALAVLRRK